MSSDLIYGVVAILTFSAIFHLLFIFLERKEKQTLASERLFLVAPNRFNMSLLIIVSVICSYSLATVTYLHSSMQALLFSIVVTAAIMALFIYKNFVWLHFLDEKIVVNYPLRKVVIEIPTRQIERSWFRATHYYIEFFEGGKKRTLSFNSPDYDRDKLGYYLLKKHIKA
jgi:hypothetical protein